jgi:hypothetical protein
VPVPQLSRSGNISSIPYKSRRSLRAMAGKRKARRHKVRVTCTQESPEMDLRRFNFDLFALCSVPIYVTCKEMVSAGIVVSSPSVSSYWSSVSGSRNPFFTSSSGNSRGSPSWQTKEAGTQLGPAESCRRPNTKSTKTTAAENLHKPRDSGPITEK